ncbi:hypothetical protein [Sphingomonas sp.]|uniref:hypothetical protein n=1 Tax=Sphingomonas sp. TaxID=28214 RepID=UPI0031D1D077
MRIAQARGQGGDFGVERAGRGDVSRRIKCLFRRMGVEPYAGSALQAQVIDPD